MPPREQGTAAREDVALTKLETAAEPLEMIDRGNAHRLVVGTTNEHDAWSQVGALHLRQREHVARCHWLHLG
jgi:hypothetical protein